MRLLLGTQSHGINVKFNYTFNCVTFILNSLKKNTLIVFLYIVGGILSKMYILVLYPTIGLQTATMQNRFLPITKRNNKN
jgi:hypothetical protein